MDFDTRHVRAFVALARELHFTNAAQRLFVTQPTLSKYVRRLEEQLGSTLFERTSRGVRLTAEGSRFLVSAERLLTVIDDIAEKSSGLLLGAMGQVGTPPDLVNRIRTTEPDLDVAIRTMSGPEQLAALRRGELSAAWMRPTERLEPGLTSALVRLEPVLVGWPHAAATPAPAGMRFSSIAVIDVGAPQWLDFFVDLAKRLAVGLTVHRPEVWASSIANTTAIAPPGEAVVALDSTLVDVRAGGAEPYATSPVQAYYPWSLVWRTDSAGRGIKRLVSQAMQLADDRGWLDADPTLPGDPWIPDSDPHHRVLDGVRERWRAARGSSTASRLPVLTATFARVGDATQSAILSQRRAANPAGKPRAAD